MSSKDTENTPDNKNKGLLPYHYLFIGTFITPEVGHILRKKEQCLKLNSFYFIKTHYIVPIVFILLLTVYNLILNWLMSEA